MYQVWTFSLPVRGVSAINQKMTIGDSTIQFFGRQIVYEIDFDPLTNVNGNLDRLDIPILAPPALAPAKRNSIPNSSIGALEMPSPHQITIWPAFLEARINGNLPSSDVLRAVQDICQNEWGIAIPLVTGFRRVLKNLPTDVWTPDDPVGDDIAGRIRDFATNDPNEYEKNIPINIAYPGSAQIDRSAYTWSCVLYSNARMINLPTEAAKFAKCLSQAMTNLENLWLYVKGEFRGSQKEIKKVENVCRAFGSLVEQIIYAIRGKSRCLRDLKSSSNPFAGLFSGSDSNFVKLLAISYPMVPSLSDIATRHRAEIEQLAKFWQKVRNPEGHEPRPALSALVDLSSEIVSIGTDEANKLARTALTFGIELVDRVELFPTGALR